MNTATLWITSDVCNIREQTMIITPKASGRQLVRVSLPLPRELLAEGQGIAVSDGREDTWAAVRSLTWHPTQGDGPRWVRRALLSFVYEFADLSPVSFELSPSESDCADATGFPVTTAIEDEAVVLRYAHGPELTLRPLAPSRESQTAPRLETVEENACFRWYRFHLMDRVWPRILEVRVGVLGMVTLVLHVQGRLEENGSAPDLGWAVSGIAAPGVLVSGETQRPLGDAPLSHSYAEGAGSELLFADGSYRLSHPAAPLKLRGRVEVSEGPEIDYRYWRCLETDEVPFQPTAWERAEVVIAPTALPLPTSTLESPHDLSVDWSWWDELYQTGPPLELQAYPELSALMEYHHRAIIRSAVRGDDWGNITSFADDRSSGQERGMNRLNHCPPIFQEGYRSGDRRLVEAAVLWCDNMYDRTIWWGADHPGGTRYPNSTTVWRSNSSVNFCTKGYDSFLIAYEHTGDPRMLEALEGQVAFASETVHAHQGECRNIGDVRDFVRLHRYTGEARHLEHALRLFTELRTRLSTGDLFDQGGRPLEQDPPFIASDHDGSHHGYAKPYIIGYALAGLPELVPLAPREPKLREVVRAVADFIATSQDPLGGWRYPHPRSPSINLSQGAEHAWQLVQADGLLGADQRHLDAVERVLRQRLQTWRLTGRIASGLGGWEYADGEPGPGESPAERYRSPDERDSRRDYDLGQPTLGTAPPEALVYLPEVLRFYLKHRPAERLLAEPGRDEPLGRFLARLEPGAASSLEPAVYPVTVDTDLDLDQMVQAAGLQRIGQQLTAANFPHPRQGQIRVDLQLHGFGRSLSTEGALEEMARLGCRPATAPELIALAATHDKLPDEFIVALGSSWLAPDGRTYVVFLVPSARRLVPYSRNCGWVSGSQFACVKQ
jgi:hypothetical protein